MKRVLVGSGFLRDVKQDHDRDKDVHLVNVMWKVIHTIIHELKWMVVAELDCGPVV
jgi:hypothetical protein